MQQDLAYCVMFSDGEGLSNNSDVLMGVFLDEYEAELALQDYIERNNEDPKGYWIAEVEMGKVEGDVLA